jgi:hypothetical protein
VTDRPQNRETSPIGAQEVRLAFLPSNDQFVVRGGTKMAADLEQDDVVKLLATPTAVAPEVGELFCVLGIGEEAAPACGLGMLCEGGARRQSHLGLAAAAGKAPQAVSLHPALPLSPRPGRMALRGNAELNKRGDQAIPEFKAFPREIKNPTGSASLADVLAERIYFRLYLSQS